jgi:nucleoside-diphosphate-sugar epimerase
MEVNYRVTKRMVEMANALHIQNVVFISSRAAGPRCGAYGASKFLAEQCVKGSTGNWLILRLAEVFGGSKLVGIDDLIHKALNRRLLLYPQGLKSKLYPISAQDVAAIVNDLVFEKGIINRVITINGNTGYSYKEIIQLAGRICGKSILAAPIPKPLLFALKAVIEKTGLNVGMAPDQVERLYCEKQTEQLGYNLLSLETYIEQCAVSAHRLTS